MLVRKCSLCIFYLANYKYGYICCQEIKMYLTFFINCECRKNSEADKCSENRKSLSKLTWKIKFINLFKNALKECNGFCISETFKKYIPKSFINSMEMYMKNNQSAGELRMPWSCETLCSGVRLVGHLKRGDSLLLGVVPQRAGISSPIPIIYEITLVPAQGEGEHIIFFLLDKIVPVIQSKKRFWKLRGKELCHLLL